MTEISFYIDRLKSIEFLFALLAAMIACSGAAFAVSVEVPRISVEKTKTLLGSPDVVIIDVRTAKTWWRSTTKIATAVREDPGAVEKWASKYPKDKTLILYCS
jgi:agmatine/peptidylarginine deiminase